MNQNPFTNDGVQLLLASIYQLPVAAYQEELYELRSNFRDWLLNRFDFSSRQEQYLNELGSDYLYHLAQEVSRAIENQSPIMLQKEARNDDDDDDDGEGKVIETNNISQSSFNLADGFHSVSSLVIHIRYRRD